LGGLPRLRRSIPPRFFDIWMRLLRQVEGSVLWLLQTSEAATRNLCDEARARGVDPLRLVFAPKVDVSLHLARHRLALGRSAGAHMHR
jgi:protein O-GlcNAc transferase